MRTIKNTAGLPIDVTTIRGGYVTLTSYCQAYDSIRVNREYRVHYSANDGACIFAPDCLRIDNGEITEDVLDKMVWRANTNE